MKRIPRELALVPLLVAGTAAAALGQAPAPPTLSSPDACPAVIGIAYDVSSFPTADRARWQVLRAAPGQDFAAAVGVDSGDNLGATGSFQKDLRNYGAVLDGTRYFVRVRARQGTTNVSEFSAPAVFELDRSADGMVTASAEADPLGVRIDWSLTGEIGACADRIHYRVDKADGAASVAGDAGGVSGTTSIDLSPHGPGDYDVRLHARFGGAVATDAVGRQSAPVRIAVAPPVVLPSLSIGISPVVEGNAVSSARRVAVRLSAPSTETGTAMVGARPGGTATEGSCGAGRDYTFPFRGISIEPGRTVAGVDLTVCGDGAVEPDETFFLGITAPVNAVLGDSIAPGTILNDDAAAAPPPAPLSVSIIDMGPVSEGNVIREATVSLALSTTSSQNVTVQVGARPEGTAREGSCGAGADYNFAFRGVTIPAGQRGLQVPYTLCGDGCSRATRLSRSDFVRRPTRSWATRSDRW